MDFDNNVIRIRRIQERDGSLTEMTKTEAGTREIPMSADAARDVARVARPLPAERQGAASRLSRPRPAAGMAEAAHRWRRAAALPELPQALLAAGLQALGLPYVTPH